MKINVVSAAKDRGSILLVTLVISAILGLTLASYLTLVSFQSRSVARSQHWNKALVIAEAGLEEGLQMVNKFAGTLYLTNWINTYAGDGWSRPGAVFMLSRSMDAANTIQYSVFITNLNALNTDLAITAVGTVTLPASIAGGTTLSRTITIRAKTQMLFTGAMSALGAIDLKGNGVATDSYDSFDPNYSGTNGIYDKTKRKANGDVATNNTITNSVLSVGNANIAGHILTGPFGSVDINNGTVGSLPWVDANTLGIETGYVRNDMNVVFDDVELPTNVWTPSVVLGLGGSGAAPDGNSYDHVYTVGGDYEVADNGSIYVATNVTVRLKATTATFSPSKIYVAGMGGTSGKMVAYLTGTKAVLGVEHQTQSAKPVNLQFFGLPSLTDLSYSGNGDFNGVIYAPQADFQLSGGGSGDIDFIGASVTKEVHMNGHYHFHYDEDLKRQGPNDGYKATGWKEL